MASFQRLLLKICEFLLYKFPLIDALTLLMLFAERAQNESIPPINPKLVYAYLIVCIGCGVMLSAGFQQKAACLVYAGQVLYFTVNFYTNPKWDYPQWQRISMVAKQVGVLGTYVMLAHLLDQRQQQQQQQQRRQKQQQQQQQQLQPNGQPVLLRRMGEVLLGLHLLALVYLLNSVPQHTEAFASHILGGHYMRYLVAVTLTGCALSFFSGYFLRDMGLCAAVTLLLVVSFVDLDLGYWTRTASVHLWSQLRQVQSSGCAIVGLLYIFCTMDNRLKVD